MENENLLREGLENGEGNEFLERTSLEHFNTFCNIYNVLLINYLIDR